MRVSSSQLFDQALGALQRSTSSTLDAQRSLSSGTRYNRASQAPLALAEASRQTERLARTGVFQDNLAALDSHYAEADLSLAAINDSLAHAQAQLISARNGALGAASLTAIGASLQVDLQSIQAELQRPDVQGRPLYNAGPDAPDRPPLEVMPGVTLARDLGLSSSTQQALAGLAQQPWANNLPGNADAALAAGLTQLQQLQDAVLSARGSVGGRWAQVVVLQDTHSAAVFVSEQARSQLVDTDIAAQASALAQSSAQLEAARTLFSKIQSGSLFSALR